MGKNTVNLGAAVTLLTVALVIGLAAGAAEAQEARPSKEALKKSYPKEGRPFAQPKTSKTYDPNTKVYWGDTHVHTGLSMDAGAFGARLWPADAYRFAKGEPVVYLEESPPAQLARPLDWLVVADHSDNMGWFPELYNDNEKITDPDIAGTDQGEIWYEMIVKPGEEAVEGALQIIDQFSKGEMDPNIMFFPTDDEFNDAWELTIQAAEDHNDPGTFTAFIGYEWTSQVPPGENLHRVVIFRDDKDKAKQTLPFTTYPPPVGEPYPEVSQVPEKLWESMDAYEKKTGGDVLAIPHNGNLSNGWMFPQADNNPAYNNPPEPPVPLTPAYAQARAKWEPLYEVTQMKGDGEAHPLLSPRDEFADFGIWDLGNLNLSEAKDEEMLPREYARSALQIGMQLEDLLGTNPYKFGMIGSTDTHTGMTTADEDNFYGKHNGFLPDKDRWDEDMISNGEGTLVVKGWELLASGYAAVWATGNTRAELFDAMERKEVYGTTGPRPEVRFFGGWDFGPGDEDPNKLAAIGYLKGVPMGGDLPARRGKGGPTFLASAMMDAAHLDRLQVIKGWVDANGERKERIYDIAVSDDRLINPDGRCPEEVGNTVDLQNPDVIDNSIGDPQFSVLWQDPNFDPKVRAFYYLRLLEIPTARWTAFDAVEWDIDTMCTSELPEGVTCEELKTSQERAYTSPIWYTPPTLPPLPPGKMKKKGA